jgi:CheY-like chemotaxis protein
MKQSKVILVAESDDVMYSLISKALEITATHTVLRLAGRDDLADFLSGSQSGKRLIPNVAYTLILDENCITMDDKRMLPDVADDLLTKIPIVVLLDSDNEKCIDRYQALGASICILKPRDEAELKDTIAKLAGFLDVVQTPLL